jgi:hypothetical protein
MASTKNTTYKTKDMSRITTEVEVEFDIEDFDTYELVSELSNRIGRFKRKALTERQVESLKSDFYELAQKLGFIDNGLTVKTLDDKIKAEHLAKVWNKYQSWEIEKLLP